MERETGVEPATSSLGSWCSTNWAILAEDHKSMMNRCLLYLNHQILIKLNKMIYLCLGRGGYDVLVRYYQEYETQ